MNIKKVFSLGTAALMAMTVLTSPVLAEPLTPGQDPANTEITDETLSLLFMAEPVCIWGAANGKLDAQDIYISSALFDTLVDVDKETGEIVPNLASEWEWIDDTHVRFTLRDDVEMTDGSPLVADDVAYTANVWMEQSANTDIGKYIAGVEVEDEHTVTLEYTTPAPDLLVMMAGAEFGIVSEDEVNALGGLEKATMNPVMGSGKYLFKEWKHG
jgi:peptide/nickel transport system substrate-binding protein